MNMVETILKVRETNPDAKLFRFRTRTTPKLTKKSRATGQPCDFSVAVESEFTAALGVNYEDEVNAKLAESGQDADFKAQKPAGKHYASGTNWLMEADKTPGRFYVALSRFSDKTVRYLVDGVEASPERVEDLKANWLPKPSASPSLVPWRTYSVESVVSMEPVG